MKANEKPSLREPVNAAKILSYRRWIAAIFAISFAGVFALSLSTDIFELSGSARKIVDIAGAILTILLLITGVLLLATTQSANIKQLEADDLTELVELSKRDNETLSFARKIKEQGRKPVVEDFKMLNRYVYELEKHELHKEATRPWESLT